LIQSYLNPSHQLSVVRIVDKNKANWFTVLGGVNAKN
jgi:hypothetical protein